MPSQFQPPLFAVAKIGHHEIGKHFDLFGVSVDRTPREFVFRPEHVVSISPAISSVFNVALHEGGRWFLGRGELLPSTDENGDPVNDLYPIGDLTEADDTGCVVSWFNEHFRGIPDEVVEILRASPPTPPTEAPTPEPKPIEPPAAPPFDFAETARKMGGAKTPARLVAFFADKTEATFREVAAHVHRAVVEPGTIRSNVSRANGILEAITSRLRFEVDDERIIRRLDAQ